VNCKWIEKSEYDVAQHLSFGMAPDPINKSIAEIITVRA
jgi:hypothetical protein